MLGASDPFSRRFQLSLRLEAKKDGEDDFKDFAVLEIYDRVVDNKVDDWWFDEGGVPIADVTAKLDEARGKPLLVRINSNGGIASAGITMFNRLREHDAEVVTVCDGMAASAASVIFMAGERRFMASGSNLMIHEPLTYVFGNRADLQRALNQLTALNDAVVDLYVETTGAKKTDVEAWLSEEKYFSPAEAIDSGFATALWSPKKADSSTPTVTHSKMEKPASQPATKLSRSVVLARAERLRSLARRA